jgi:hypothetical protein
MLAKKAQATPVVLGSHARRLWALVGSPAMTAGHGEGRGEVLWDPDLTGEAPAMSAWPEMG